MRAISLLHVMTGGLWSFFLVLALPAAATDSTPQEELAAARRLYERVVPAWQHNEGDPDWIEGCALDDLELRGLIPAELDQKKLRKHLAICLSHCGPPSCSFKLAETSCDCLNCAMYCLMRGSYVGPCQTNNTYALCTRYQKSISASDGSTCEVDCNYATGLQALGAAFLLSMALLFTNA
eukprot:TRINITY_DN74977_c0_g1_i1.p1 TRINITY_DN74977_c0_g1~~TRINITY_DN74977_c0_g1_i1.p1  ORF type:complete len:180 (+),score=34.31 TRINITY_DN74977_c0_g1_i1:44-583(+)